jgi:hypothetical protein
MHPNQPEAISLDWINSEFLTAAKLPAAVNFNIAPIGENVGFLGDLCRLVVEYDADNEGLPKSFIVKFPTLFEGGLDAGLNMSAYKREVDFYREISNKLPWCQPPKFYFSAEISEGEHLVIIEDLDGHRFVPQVAGINHQDAKDVVVAMARLHAHYWESEALSKMDWLMPLASFGESLPASIETGWPLFEKKFSYLLDPDLAELYPIANRLYAPMIYALQRQPGTLLHGDPRMENVAFTDASGPESVRFYDWQLCAHGPAAYDLMYFFIMSVNVEDWNVIGESLIELHHSELVSNGVTNYDMTAFREDLALSSCLMFGWGSNAGGLLPDDESGHAFMRATSPRAENVIKALGGPETLLAFERSYKG